MKTLKKWLLFFLLIIVFTSGCSKSTTEDNGKKSSKTFSPTVMNTPPHTTEQMKQIKKVNSVYMKAC